MLQKPQLCYNCMTIYQWWEIIYFLVCLCLYFSSHCGCFGNVVKAVCTDTEVTMNMLNTTNALIMLEMHNHLPGVNMVSWWRWFMSGLGFLPLKFEGCYRCNFNSYNYGPVFFVFHVVCFCCDRLWCAWVASHRLLGWGHHADRNLSER